MLGLRGNGPSIPSQWDTTIVQQCLGGGWWSNNTLQVARLRHPDADSATHPVHNIRCKSKVARCSACNSWIVSVYNKCTQSLWPKMSLLIMFSQMNNVSRATLQAESSSRAVLLSDSSYVNSRAVHWPMSKFSGMAGGDLGVAAPAPTNSFSGIQLDTSSSWGPHRLERC